MTGKCQAPPEAGLDLVYLTSTFEPDIGGTVRQVAGQARALAARGYRITVLTKKTKPHAASTEQLDGINVVRLNYRPGRAGDLLYLLASGLWLCKHRQRIDMVQAVLHPEFLLPTLPAGLLNRTALLWVGRGTPLGHLPH